MPKAKLVTDVSKYGSGLLISRLIGIAKGIVIANVLGPAHYGVWGILQMFLNWGEMSHLGLKNAMMRERTLLLGAKKINEANLVRDVAISTTLIFTSLFSLGIVIASIVFHFPPLLLQTSWAIALVSLFFQLYSSLSVLMRSEERFGGLSKAITLSASVGLAITLLLIFTFDIWGAIIASFLAQLVGILYLTKQHMQKFRFRVNINKAKELLGMGLGLFVLGSMIIMLRSVDKAIVAAFLNMKQVGFYTMGVVISSVLYLFPSSFVDVVFPRTLMRIGETNSLEEVKKHVLVPNIFLSHTMPFLIVGGYMFIPLVIQLIAPSYLSSIGTTQILLLASFFFSLYFSPVRSLIAMKKERLAIAGALFALLMNVGVNYYAVMVGYGIEGVAIGTLLSYMILALIMLALLLANYPEQSALKYIANLLYPFFWLVLVIIIVDMLFGKGISIMLTAQRFTLSMILMAPLLYLVEKQTSAISEALSILKKR